MDNNFHLLRNFKFYWVLKFIIFFYYIYNCGPWPNPGYGAALRPFGPCILWEFILSISLDGFHFVNYILDGPPCGLRPLLLDWPLCGLLVHILWKFHSWHSQFRGSFTWWNTWYHPAYRLWMGRHAAFGPLLPCWPPCVLDPAMDCVALLYVFRPCLCFWPFYLIGRFATIFPCLLFGRFAVFDPDMVCPPFCAFGLFLLVGLYGHWPGCGLIFGLFAAVGPVM